MPSPKSGTPCTIVPPTAPTEALDADNADPGKVEEAKKSQRSTGKGKYGTVKVKPHKKETPEEAAQNSQSEEKKKSWVKLKLVDRDNKPVAGEPYKVALPDGSVADGTTGADGLAAVEGFEPGQCKISFPNLDKSVVKAK